MATIDISSREKRNSVIVRALVETPDGRERERRVRNLSDRGACIEHDGELQAGMTLVLRMGAISDLYATVRWVSGRLAGLRFSETVNLDEARKPRGAAIQPKVGWIVDINDAYRR